MKPNRNHLINIRVLKDIELIIPDLLKDPSLWKTLDVDYYPPRVERLYTTYGEYRIFLHTIHSTISGEKVLYHKHRWPAVFKQLKGSYEMGITYSEKEVNSEEAYNLPDIAKFRMVERSYYEMTQTDCLHYVKPISEVSYSIMLTNDLYPEAIFRKEVLDKSLKELSLERKNELLITFKSLI